MGDLINMIKKKRRSFGFNGHEYKYFLNKYNKTWRNERCVEIPIIKKFIANPFERILEVGNVTKHYYKNNHFVIDKYEKDPGVINADILDFDPYDRYDKIIAISTLEHVGEDVGKPELAIEAIEHLKTLIAPSGEMIITIPAGFNKPLEEKLFDLGMEIYGMLSINDLWAPCRAEDLKGIEYDFNNHTAIGLYICIFKKRP